MKIGLSFRAVATSPTNTSVAKELKLKVKRFWWLISTFVEVTGEKLSPPLHPSPSLVTNIKYYCNISFNRDLNCDFLVCMFSLRFSGSQFLINLWRLFHVRKIFSCT